MAGVRGKGGARSAAGEGAARRVRSATRRALRAEKTLQPVRPRVKPQEGEKGLGGNAVSRLLGA